MPVRCVGAGVRAAGEVCVGAGLRVTGEACGCRAKAALPGAMASSPSLGTDTSRGME